MNESQPSLNLTKSIGRAHDVVVIGLAETGAGPSLVGLPADVDKSFLKKFGTDVLALALDLGAKPKPDSVTILPGAGPRLVVAGLGEPDVTPAQIRRAVANATRSIASLPGEEPLKVAISLELGDPELLQAAAEAAVLGQYRVRKVTKESLTSRVGSIDIISSSARSEARDAIQRAHLVAEAVCAARDLVNMPPNLLYPESFVAAAKDLLKGSRVAVEALDEKALEKGGYGGILAVGGGSSRKPRLLRMEYAPRGAKTHLGLVGKGITFDSGGLNLKPSSGMLTMKCDMAGAAAVLAAVNAIARLGLKVRVTAYAALAENLPSDTAYRPSDVLTMFDGQTVENVNTDAEGRLVMADALARSNGDDPDLLVDVATLTGACVVALGERCAGLLASDDSTADLLLDAAEAAGETFWQLPITEQAREALDSPIADMKSGTTAKVGGTLVAAAFLQRFVDSDRAWAHLDIAGPAYNEGSPYDEVPSGGTGVAVRTLVALASSLAG
ncbi:MAG: leucyl aminopeptidase [Propionibacteriaceae bacterium]|nr:leucyl aminopeptidase [Propionibacteriaceae bacterium]